jgi:opacity protein-like surface antigen
MKDAKLYMKTGICSLCSDERHIPMFDIDLSIGKMDAVIADLKKMQKKHKAGDLYVFTTKNGFHVYGLDKFSLSDVNRMYYTLDHGDKAHRRIAFYYRKHYVLRLGNDISFTYKLKQQTSREKSNAHRIFLNKYFGLQIPETELFDQSTSLLIEHYPQRSKGHIPEAI